jgi:hypothetical protein
MQPTFCLVVFTDMGRSAADEICPGFCNRVYVDFRSDDGRYHARNRSTLSSNVFIRGDIGFGALGLSWMNDSGFWIISRLSGFTTRETLGTRTVLAFAMSVFGLFETLRLAAIFPFN